MPEIEAVMTRYGTLMDRAVKSGRANAEPLAEMFDAAFIASSPRGVMSGNHDESLAKTIAGGIEHYRSVGATAFVVEAVRSTEIDDCHGMAAVDWRFDYERPSDGQAGSIRFTNHYLLRRTEDGWKIFGWMTPDEQAAMAEHGLG